MHTVWILFSMALLASCAVGLYGAIETIRIPLLAVPYTPRDFGWPFESVTFKSRDGLKLTGWFIPADQPSPLTLIIQHGVGSNAGDMLLNTACLRKGGKWNLFYYNFRGHADSEGRQTSLGPLELKDLDGALAFLKEKKPEASKRIGLYGHSLGAAVAIVGTARRPEIEAVALESPFSSVSKTVAHFAKVFYGIPYFPFVPLALFFASLRLRSWIGGFAPVKEIGKISPRPLLLIQAERDLRMPMSDAQSLWEAASEPKEMWVVPGADHGEPWLVAREEYEQRLVNFFRKVFQ